MSKAESQSMKSNKLLLLILACLPLAAVAAEGPVHIDQHTITLQRGKPGQSAPDFKRTTIHFAEVVGLPSAVVQRHVNDAISVKAATGESIEQKRKAFKEEFWLSSIDDKVLYNKHDLVSLLYTVEGSGAYPSTYLYYVNADVRTGRALIPSVVFRPDHLHALASRLDAKFQKEIKTALQTKVPEALTVLKQELGGRHFKVSDLKRFSLDSSGITFHYDYGFPHAVLDLQPAGEFHLSWADLKADLRLEGPLARMQR
jgi:hypothetical protein